MWDILPFDIRFIIFKTLDIKHKKMIYYIDREREYSEIIASGIIENFFHYGKTIPNENEICIIFSNCLNNMYRKVALPINSIIKLFPKFVLEDSIYRFLYINRYNRFNMNNKEKVLWFLYIIQSLNIWKNFNINGKIYHTYSEYINYLDSHFNYYIPYIAIKGILKRINKRQYISILTHFTISDDPF